MSKRGIDVQSAVIICGVMLAGLVLLVVACQQLTHVFAGDPENPTLVFNVQDGGNQSIGSTNSTTGGVSGSTLYYAINDTLTLDAYIDCSGNNWTVEIDNNGNNQYGGNDTNQVLCNTTLTTLGAHTLEASADNVTITVGPITGTLMIMDMASAKAKDEGGTFQTGTVNRGLPTNGTLSVPVQVYLTDGNSSVITDEAQSPYSFGWNLTPPGGSSATLADSTKLGTNVTGIDVAGNYGLEARAGSNSSVGNVTLRLIEIQSVTVNQTTIAAGAKNTTPHQTTVDVTINPAVLGVPINLSLFGGNGYSGNTTKFGQQVTWYGPAKLEGGNQTYVAGETGAPISVNTDAQGKATVTLTSSNRLLENTTVKAEFGASSMNSGLITFAFPYVQVDIVGPLALGGNQSVNASVSYNFQPLEGHDIFTYVRNVKVNGTWLKDPWLVDFEWQTNSTAMRALMDLYAEITQGARQDTPTNGNISATVQLEEGVDLDEISVGAADASVHDGSNTSQ